MTTAAPTIFPVLSINRAVSRWEDRLNDLTPVEQGASGNWYKREDAFAPLGYGGINGSKLRQLIWLVDQYRLGAAGHPSMVTGASVLSPQSSMAALVARHFGVQATVILGGTRPDIATRHENIAIAAAAGADFQFIPIGYNPALQAAVKAEHERRPGSMMLHYGITTAPTATDGDIAAFHALGARQAMNIPAGVETIYVTAGSCNSCVSLLYGIHVQQPAIRRVVLTGIGPTRITWIADRLAAISRANGTDIATTYRDNFQHHRDLEGTVGKGGPIELAHVDLHSTKWCQYSDKMPETRDGIAFHPTYEGKMIRYARDSQHPLYGQLVGQPDRCLVWIVGSRPTRAAMAGALS